MSGSLAWSSVQAPMVMMCTQSLIYVNIGSLFQAFFPNKVKNRGKCKVGQPTPLSSPLPKQDPQRKEEWTISTPPSAFVPPYTETSGWSKRKRNSITLLTSGRNKSASSLLFNASPSPSQLGLLLTQTNTHASSFLLCLFLYLFFHLWMQNPWISSLTGNVQLSFWQDLQNKEVDWVLKGKKNTFC